jgi:uncharacterized sodium:solute symporter family permease YidK
MQTVRVAVLIRLHFISTFIVSVYIFHLHIHIQYPNCLYMFVRVFHCWNKVRKADAAAAQPLVIFGREFGGVAVSSASRLTRFDSDQIELVDQHAETSLHT